MAKGPLFSRDLSIGKVIIIFVTSSHYYFVDKVK